MADKRKNNRGQVGRRWAAGVVRVVGYIPADLAKQLQAFGKNQSDAVRTAIDAALHPMDGDSDVIRLADSLPCGIRADTPSGVCGKPATVAHVNPLRSPVLPGHYVVLPVCQECAAAAAAVYGTLEEGERCEK